MLLRILAVGRPQTGWRRDAVEHYMKFLSKYTEVASLWVKAAGAALNPSSACKQEGVRLLDKIEERAYVIVADQRGASVDSMGLSNQVQTAMVRKGGRIDVVIGGAEGLSQSVITRANWVWSLSPLTLPHELALIVCLEQLARAFSIQRGDKYHR